MTLSTAEKIDLFSKIMSPKWWDVLPKEEFRGYVCKLLGIGEFKTKRVKAVTSYEALKKAVVDKYPQLNPFDILSIRKAFRVVQVR